MRDEEDGLAFGKLFDGLVKDVGAHAGVDGAERVVQEEDGPVAVKCSGQTHPLPLPSAQVDAPLSNLPREKLHKSSDDATLVLTLLYFTLLYYSCRLHMLSESFRPERAT